MRSPRRADLGVLPQVVEVFGAVRATLTGVAKNRAQRRAAQAARVAPARPLGPPPRPATARGDSRDRTPQASGVVAVARSVEWQERLVAAVGEVRSAESEVALVVLDARAAGATWADVGAVLGVSRQSAHERFSGSGTAR